MITEQNVMGLRRVIIEGLAARGDVTRTLVNALELATNILLKEGVQSLGDVGRRAEVFGRGSGVVIGVTYAEVTTYTMYMLLSRQIKKVTAEEFKFYEVA